MDRTKALQLVNDERDRQDAKWGVQRHDAAIWQLILAEEVGEVAQATLVGDPHEVIKEVVQVAAVALAFLEQCPWLQIEEAHSNGVPAGGGANGCPSPLQVEHY